MSSTRGHAYPIWIDLEGTDPRIDLREYPLTWMHGLVTHAWVDSSPLPFAMTGDIATSSRRQAPGRFLPNSKNRRGAAR